MADNSTDLSSSSCGSGSPYNGRFGLRVASIFIILATSVLGTLFPIISRKLTWVHVHDMVYDFAKYFGSGVIIATAFIHLLAPANASLTSPCLVGTWTVYPWPQAIAMASVFFLFIIEMIAFRAGHARLAKIGIVYHSHGTKGDEGSHGHADHPHHIGGGGSSVASPPHQHHHEVEEISKRKGVNLSDESLEAAKRHMDRHEVAAQILGAAILEFGVIFHSVVIGLTLAVDDNFVTLFVVIIFHQMFEGLGLGSRLAQLPLPNSLDWVPFVAGLIYSCVTPLGIGIGLGVRMTYNPNSATAVMVSGVLDSFSAGILLYTGLVELIAHDFVFNKAMMLEASNAKLTFAVGSVLTGAGIMALLGRWA